MGDPCVQGDPHLWVSLCLGEGAWGARGECSVCMGGGACAVEAAGPRLDPPSRVTAGQGLPASAQDPAAPSHTHPLSPAYPRAAVSLRAGRGRPGGRGYGDYVSAPIDKAGGIPGAAAVARGGGATCAGPGGGGGSAPRSRLLLLLLLLLLLPRPPWSLPASSPPSPPPASPHSPPRRPRPRPARPRPPASSPTRSPVAPTARAACWERYRGIRGEGEPPRGGAPVAAWRIEWGWEGWGAARPPDTHPPSAAPAWPRGWMRPLGRRTPPPPSPPLPAGPQQRWKL